MLMDRALSGKFIEMADKFPLIFLAGPRFSGKSSLLKQLFQKKFEYATLEDKDLQNFANEDPAGFVNSFVRSRVIIDDIHRVPALIPFIKEKIDRKDAQRMFILSGFLDTQMKEKISQLLSGRALKLSLLPFSLPELSSSDKLPKTADEWMFRGTYPELIYSNTYPGDFFQRYVSTLIERDLGAKVKMYEYPKFWRFLSIVAVNSGSPINFSMLGEEVSIDARTAISWVSILEEMYILFRVVPHEGDFLKRYVRTPKLYFYDTGLLCFLLGLKSFENLKFHKMRALVFETAIVSEIMKTNYHNIGFRPKVYYCRDLDNREKEIDLIEARRDGLIFTDIKNTQTVKKENLRYLLSIIQQQSGLRIKDIQFIYEGSEDVELEGVRYRNWKSLGRI